MGDRTGEPDGVGGAGTDLRNSTTHLARSATRETQTPKGLLEGERNSTTGTGLHGDELTRPGWFCLLDEGDQLPHVAGLLPNPGCHNPFLSRAGQLDQDNAPRGG